VTSSLAALDELGAVELARGYAREDVDERRPHGSAVEQAHEDAGVQNTAVVWSPGLGRRVHDASILVVLALCQIGWLAALAYGAFSLLP
jgi:hypothetical protein